MENDSLPDCTLAVDSRRLLGPCTPLPALFEEVLRAQRGFSVQSVRLREFRQLLDSVAPSSVPPVFQDDHAPADARMLTAIVAFALQAPPDGMEMESDELGAMYTAIAAFADAESGHWYRQQMEASLSNNASDEDLPSPLLLLAFLHGLHHGWLDPEQFDACVIEGKTLSPEISPHRRLRARHRLLDYLGVSQQAPFQQYYRQLTARIWPTARLQNWPDWRWITQPGGPELFAYGLHALCDGDVSLPRLYELKYSPLPDAEWLTTHLAQAPCHIALLLGWMRREQQIDELVAGVASDRWLHESNLQATRAAYSALPWWEEWLTHGLPSARAALLMIQSLPLPVADNDRASFIEHFLLPGYRGICANLLLAQAAAGDDLPAVLHLAEQGDTAALHALGLAPDNDDAVIAVLRRHASAGHRKAQGAAQLALDRIARQQGLPDEQELRRQQLLNAALDVDALAGERVRVGWQVGGYRLRVGLRRGQVELDVLGPRGELAHVPTAIRKSAAYQQARTVQAAVKAQYRLFRQYLEEIMVNEQPLLAGVFLTLLTNPVFAHLAERLLWCCPDGRCMLWNGPDRWETLTGECVRFTDAALTLLVAHPIRLLRQQTLQAWQSVAADRRLVQPFKQIFREVYACDKAEETVCRRFSGRAIDPARAYALLRAAGFAPGSGDARREWRGEITAHICWARDASGRDLYGEHRLPSVVSGDIHFARHGELVLLPDVNPLIISETLRAADLLTTRAAVGDADLTSRETILLRATLLREIARSYGLTNLVVREEGPYALVLGSRATYRINLANGAISLEPEGRHIAPPHQQDSWLSSEDPDATATIISVILTLAEDEKINDLIFLAQLD